MTDNVYEGKTLEDLLHDIHDKTGEKREYIKSVIEKIITALDPEKADSLIMIGPIIKEYLDLLTRVDEHYIKLATIVQRVISAKAYAGAIGKSDMILTDEEQTALYDSAMKELREASIAVDVIDNKNKSLIN